MRISIISDVHIKNKTEKCYQDFLKFLKSQHADESETIIFLGDIFDLMIGPHEKYFTEFDEYFNELENLLRRGKKVIYFEGNHDFHLKKLYAKFFKKRSLHTQNFLYKKGCLRIENKGTNIYMSHGDDIELGNRGYKMYKALINNFFTSFLANYVVPYSFIRCVGRRASAKSRQRNIEQYGNDQAQTTIKESFRKAAESVWRKENVDIIICGHSHIKDDFESKQGFRYINNGFFPRDNSFIFISNGEIKQMLLN